MGEHRRACKIVRMQDRIGEKIETAARCRKHARELRAKAQFDAEGDAGAVLTGIAAEYDRMAAIVERIDRTTEEIVKIAVGRKH